MNAVVAALVDVFVDDACHLCTRRYRAGVDTADLDPVRRALTVAVQVGPLQNHPVCARCAARLMPAPGVATLPAPGGNLRVVAAFHTTPLLLELIHRFKFGRVTSLAVGLSAALAVAADCVLAGLADPAVVPVPMDPRSQRRRGFNQSALVAARLAGARGIALVPRALEKPRPTAPQSLMPADGRGANVAGAYRAGPDPVAGRDVVLVDDLVTTGATAAAAAAVVAARGAASVTVAGIGRAV